MRRYRFLRSRRKIELDITWLCNLTCFDCNRCCGEAPTTEHMSLEQIDRFIAESIERNYEWTIIRLMGGEPTLHPQFLEVIDKFVAYQRSFPKHKAPRIFVFTNGFSKKSQKLVAQLPPEIEVVDTEKERGTVQHFGSFYVAPTDVRDTTGEDFTLACSQATSCGMGLTPYGYYHCPVAGSIDRVFGGDKGVKTLPDLDDDMFDMAEDMCSKCGFYDMDDGDIFVSQENLEPLTSDAPVSKSWDKAFKKLRAEGKNNLTRY